MPGTRIEFRPRPQRRRLALPSRGPIPYQSVEIGHLDRFLRLSKQGGFKTFVPTRLLLLLLLLLLSSAVPAVVIVIVVVVIVGDVISRSSSLAGRHSFRQKQEGDNSGPSSRRTWSTTERGVRVPTRLRSSFVDERQCGGTARQNESVVVVVASRRGRLLVVGREECALCPKTSSLGCDVVEMEKRGQ
jgi:uncharacterized membrane protein YecN with MAPEG domain